METAANLKPHVAFAAVVMTLAISLVVAGTGLDALIVNVWLLDVPPPGVGLNTVTEADPADAMSAAVIEAVS